MVMSVATLKFQDDFLLMTLASHTHKLIQHYPPVLLPFSPTIPPKTIQGRPGEVKLLVSLKVEGISFLEFCFN